jgi:peptidoglycan-N-acetylglucosamine deacetylase
MGLEHEVRDILHIMGRLPWPFIILFNIASMLALILAIALVQTLPKAAPKAKAAIASNPNAKRIAFSFDDAPRGPGAFLELDKRPAMLIQALRDGGVKGAAFFNNPGRISGINKGAESIAAYANAGHLIANHTHNHAALSTVTPEKFLAEVDEAEVWLKRQKNYRPWFRFPRLDEGRKDIAKRDAVRAGLKARGIRNAYVTADGWDWFMESRSIAAKRAGRTMNVEGLRKLYIETHVESANFADRLAKRILGRRPVQMLLLHETDLAAMFVDDLAKALRADGWEIVSADIAYADPMAQMEPDPKFADGTRLEMLAWGKGITGDRWFPRNNTENAQKLFTTYAFGE